MKKIYTLCMVCKDGTILLGMKKVRFGAGMWNGFGGKVEEGETIEAASYRELQEEAGLTAYSMKKMGVITFSFEEGPEPFEVHIFKTADVTGEPTESDEMTPQWFSVDAIPYEKMWADDAFWLPLLLDDKQFEGAFYLDKPSTPDYSARILTQDLKTLES
jgi:8-oxo-dGTP diphosphatase/2-hydroxy-dATP diphosphatase